MKSKQTMMGLVVLLVLCSASTALGAERWYNYYKDGVRLSKAGQYAQAILAFEEAMDVGKMFADSRKKVQTYGMHFIDYHPHREIGIAAYQLGERDRARRELELSIAYSPSDRAIEYLDRLGGGKPGQRTVVVEKKESEKISKEDAKDVQLALAHEGYYTGSIDGILGPGSGRAIRAFQRDNRLKPTGKPDKKTLSKLRKIKVASDYTPHKPAAPMPHVASAAKSASVRRVGPRLKVAVLPLTAKGGAEEMGSLLPDRIVTSLVEYQRFRVMERQQLDKVLKEQKLGLTDLVDPETAVRLGKLAGVDCLVVGSIWQAGGTFDIDVRLLDSETGEVLATRSGQAPTGRPSEIRRVASDIAAYFANILPLAEGFVVKVKPDGIVYVDLGSRDGMRKGMKFVVFAEGEEIKHPKTGELLGTYREKTAELVIIEIMERVSVARPVEGQEGLVQVNDSVVTK